ncbi:MAG: hypothetical protein K8J31_26345 [Anaerolineae bacterium]|nr:hypothetical protein [Anaerolineae bacterium]
MRRLLLVIAAVIVLIGVILLLNFTASNPSGRRYSSEIPLTTGEGKAGEIGGDGERILAKDLGLPNNNAPGQRQCACGTSSGTPSQCNLCFAHSALIQNYRVPDFVSPNFVAEAKNVRQLLVSYDRDFRQISEIAAAAREADLPFWLYVRVDTVVDGAFHALFAGMKGGIVYYFAVPEYVDSLDRLGQLSLLAGLILIIALLVWGWLLRLSLGHSDEPPSVPLRRASQPDPNRSLDEAEDFLRRAKDRARSQIDQDKDNGKQP